MNEQTYGTDREPAPATANGMGEQVRKAAHTAADQARDLRHRAEVVAGDLSQMVKARPLSSLAIAAGVAFALGALWKINSARRPSSRLDALLAQMPDVPGAAERLWSRHWR